MRRLTIVALSVTACGGADPPQPTSGPLASIVHVGPTAVQLYAYRHRLDLAALPIDPPAGWAPAGTVELDASITIPLDLLRPALPFARGRAALRCVAGCRLGDAATGVTVTSLEVGVTIRGGVARITRWALASPDLEAEVGLTVRLARDPDASGLDGCARVRPTAALLARAPALEAGVAQLGAPDADGWYRVRLAGTVADPRFAPAPCAPAIGP